MRRTKNCFAHDPPNQIPEHPKSVNKAKKNKKKTEQKSQDTRILKKKF